VTIHQVLLFTIESESGTSFEFCLAVEREMRTPAVPTAIALLLTGCGGADTSPTELSDLCRIYASSVTGTTTHTFTGMPPTLDTKNLAIVYNTVANQLLRRRVLGPLSCLETRSTQS
jgi:hypothetical protein